MGKLRTEAECGEKRRNKDRSGDAGVTFDTTIG